MSAFRLTGETGEFDLDLDIDLDWDLQQDQKKKPVSVAHKAIYRPSPIWSRELKYWPRKNSDIESSTVKKIIY